MKYISTKYYFDQGTVEVTPLRKDDPDRRDYFKFSVYAKPHGGKGTAWKTRTGSRTRCASLLSEHIKCTKKS